MKQNFSNSQDYKAAGISIRQEWDPFANILPRVKELLSSARGDLLEMCCCRQIQNELMFYSKIFHFKHF